MRHPAAKDELDLVMDFVALEPARGGYPLVRVSPPPSAVANDRIAARLAWENAA